MKFGVQVGSNEDSLRACADRARIAENCGIDFIGFGDTQVIYRDCYSVLTACCLSTNRVQLGPVVTNPLTRNPVVLANILATIDEASGGRAYMAIGAGASSVANASLARAKPKELAQALRVFRSAYREAPGPAANDSLDESVISIKWAKRKVPIVVHASGPLGFQVAAEWGDAVMVRLGDTDIDTQSKQFEAVRAAHARGPRNGLPFDHWIYAPMAIGDAASILGVVSARAVTLKPELCPPELLEAHARYVAQYDYKFHGSVTEPKNFRLLEKLGLAEYMIERFSLVGDEDHVLNQWRKLARAGVTHLMADASGPDHDRAIGIYGALAQRFRSEPA
jgi:alkanesulfonate monooxygenase SsuD/methylene tetrahydromethanopterin reductase-like flavin-dependent oxidoreductase (luciferase family)